MMMTGTFSSAEQAVTANKMKPYLQRIYRVTANDNGEFESRVYCLPEQEKYIHGWEHQEIFDSINPESLIIREGCAVFLSKNSVGCYSGSAKNRDCISNLRGASFATSIVTICPKQIMSWDQGWNDDAEQVWGAEKSGYVFKRIE